MKELVTCKLEEISKKIKKEKRDRYLKYLIMSLLGLAVTKKVMHLHESSKLARSNLSFLFLIKCIFYFLLIEYLSGKDHKLKYKKYFTYALLLSYAVLKNTRPQCNFEEAISYTLNRICIDRLILYLLLLLRY